MPTEATQNGLSIGCILFSFPSLILPTVLSPQRPFPFLGSKDPFPPNLGLNVRRGSANLSGLNQHYSTKRNSRTEADEHWKSVWCDESFLWYFYGSELRPHPPSNTNTIQTQQRYKSVVSVSEFKFCPHHLLTVSKRPLAARPQLLHLFSGDDQSPGYLRTQVT